MAKVILKGTRSHHRINISGLVEAGINIRKIPAFFNLEVDTENIKITRRERGLNNKEKLEKNAKS